MKLKKWKCSWLNWGTISSTHHQYVTCHEERARRQTRSDCTGGDISYRCVWRGCRGHSFLLVNMKRGVVCPHPATMQRLAVFDKIAVHAQILWLQSGDLPVVGVTLQRPEPRSREIPASHYSVPRHHVCMILDAANLRDGTGRELHCLHDTIQQSRQWTTNHQVHLSLLYLSWKYNVWVAEVQPGVFYKARGDVWLWSEDQEAVGHVTSPSDRITTLTGGKGVKLLKLDVPAFDDQVINWRSFWEQFDISIHSQSNLLMQRSESTWSILSRMA